MADLKKADDIILKLRTDVASDMAATVVRMDSQNSDMRNYSFRNILTEYVNAYETYTEAHKTLLDAMPKRKAVKNE